MFAIEAAFAAGPAKYAGGSPGSAREMKKVRTTTPARLGMVPSSRFQTKAISGSPAIIRCCDGFTDPHHRARPHRKSDAARGQRHASQSCQDLSKRYATADDEALKQGPAKLRRFVVAVRTRVTAPAFGFQISLHHLSPHA